MGIKKQAISHQSSARPHLAKPNYFGLFGLLGDTNRSFDGIYSRLFSLDLPSGRHEIERDRAQIDPLSSLIEHRIENNSLNSH